MPLFHIRGTTILKAFILNAIASALIIVFTIEFKDFLYTKLKTKSSIIKTLIVFFSSFLVSVLIYIFLYLLLDFGGGMTASTKKLSSFWKIKKKKK